MFLSKKIVSLRGERIADLLAETERDPSDANAYHRLGVAYLRIGEAEKASGALNWAIQLGDDSADVYASIGEAFLILGLYGQAIEACQASLQREPKADVYFIICDALIALGRYDEAKNVCDEVCRLVTPEQNGRVIDTYYILGIVFFENARYQESLEVLEELLRIDEGHEDTLAMIHKVRFMAGDLNEVVDPDEVEALEELDDEDGLWD